VCQGVDGQSEVLLGLTKLHFGDEQSESSHERMNRTAMGSPDRGQVRGSVRPHVATTIIEAMKGPEIVISQRRPVRCCLSAVGPGGVRRLRGAVVGKRSGGSPFSHQDNTRCRSCGAGPSVALGSGTADRVITVVTTGRSAIPRGGTVAASLTTATSTTTAATSATANHAWVRSTTGRGGGGRPSGTLTARSRPVPVGGELPPVSRRGPAAGGPRWESGTLVVMVTGDQGWFAVTSMG